MKKLNYKKIRFSPEIEVEFPENREDYDETELNEIKKLTQLEGWSVVFEGSLEYGWEYKPKPTNKLFFNSKGLKQIRDVIKRIKKYDGRTEDWCGLHIHIDMSKIGIRNKRKIIKNFIKNQDKIMKKFKVETERIGYCDYIYDTTPIYRRKSTALSTSSFKTLEFRIFNGTLDYKKIKQRIEWTLKFVVKSLED